MKYVTIADLARTIRGSFARIPHDVDFVVGVPRSGVLAGSIIAELLNVPLIDADSFAAGARPTGGRRVSFHAAGGRAVPRALVVDDTIFNGGSMKETRYKLSRFAGRYEFVFMVVYREGPCGAVDFWLEDLRGYTGGDCPFVLYEWNILHHVPRIMSRCLYDMDGVLCVEPPDERDTEAYESYIENAVPLFATTSEIGEIVTYRLRKYEAATRRWLDGHGIRYGALTMYEASSPAQRAIGPAQYKAEVYRQRGDAMLFVESSDRQAREIARLTGRPVYCVESNTLY